MIPASRSRRFASVLILFTLLFSYGMASVPAEAADPRPASSSPWSGFSQPPGPDDPIIPPTTKVLSLQAPTAERAMTGARRFSLSARSPRIRGLRPGDVLAGGPTSFAPNGYLLKVVSVSRWRGQVEIQTRPASLTEAIQQGSVEMSRSLSGLEVRQAVELEGVGLQSTTPTIQASGLEVRLDRVVLADSDGDLNTTFDQVVANGRVLLEPSLSLRLRIRDFEVQEFSFISETRETSDLQLITSVELVDYHVRQEVAKYTFAPIVVWVGTVPVVFTPVLAVHVGLDGTVTVGITTSVSQQATFTAGATYVGGEWSPVSEISPSFSFSPPTLFATAKVAAYTGPQLSLMVYGVAGPYTQTQSYLELVADPFQVPWWQLFTGLRGKVGVKVEVLGRLLASYEATLFDEKWLLAEAEGGFPASATDTPQPALEPDQESAG